MLNPKTISIVIRTLSIAVCLLVICKSNFSFANISAPPVPHSGNIIGTGPMGSISVLHEDLTVNFSDIVKGGLVHITAVYKINCPERIDLMDLVFVANNMEKSRYRISIDNKFIKGRLLPFDTIPSGWLPPDSITWNNRNIPYKYTYKGLLPFRLDTLSAGEHLLEVSYDADASSWFEEDDLAQYRALVYILRPSDSWKNFGSIDINIFIPASWDFSSNLHFNRLQPFALHGHWNSLPAAFFSMTIHKPTKNAKIVSTLFQVICWMVIALLLFWWLPKVARGKIAEREKRILKMIYYGFVSFIISAAFFVIGSYKFDVLALMLDNDLNPMVIYGKGYSIFLFPFIWILSFSMVVIIDYCDMRRIKYNITKR